VEKQRKKSWENKVEIVKASYLRSSRDVDFASNFYKHLFFLKPKIKDYFVHTDFEHQDKALTHGLEFFMGFLDHSDENARTQVLRISQTHSKFNLNIHPHDYYYWIEALVMTVKTLDPSWYKDMEYYWREVISYPVSFMISQYFKESKAD
jgi:hemoglobin-like flavoprotein